MLLKLIILRKNYWPSNIQYIIWSKFIRHKPVKIDHASLRCLVYACKAPLIHQLHLFMGMESEDKSKLWIHFWNVLSHGVCA